MNKFNLDQNKLKTEDPIDFWNELTFEQRKEIEEASLEIEQGVIIDYEAFIKKHK